MWFVLDAPVKRSLIQRLNEDGSGAEGKGPRPPGADDEEPEPEVLGHQLQPERNLLRRPRRPVRPRPEPRPQRRRHLQQSVEISQRMCKFGNTIEA